MISIIINADLKIHRFLLQNNSIIAPLLYFFKKDKLVYKRTIIPETFLIGVYTISYQF